MDSRPGISCRPGAGAGTAGWRASGTWPARRGRTPRGPPAWPGRGRRVLRGFRVPWSLAPPYGEEMTMHDHRKLGRELELFDTDPLIGAGLPYWLPDAQLPEAEALAAQAVGEGTAGHGGPAGIWQPGRTDPRQQDGALPAGDRLSRGSRRPGGAAAAIPDRYGPSELTSPLH